MTVLKRRMLSFATVITILAFVVAYSSGAFTGVVGDESTRLSESTVDELQAQGFQPINDERGVSFERPTPDGDRISLERYRGKLVILNFWATWCPPCKEEMPSMQRLWENHRDDLVVLAMNMDEPARSVSSFVERFGLSFPIALDDQTLARRLQVSALPTTYLIGPEGHALAKLEGPIQWDRRAVIEALQSIRDDTGITNGPEEGR